MASVESAPAYLQPGVSVSQPPHLEGDPSLATEILPGPPPLASIQQAGVPRKDHKKSSVSYSYLPSADPGTTYTTHFAMTALSAAPADLDGARRKRARLDKGAESSRSQRASARSLAVVAPSSEPIPMPEATASSSHALSDFDPQHLSLDSDDAMVSRATSVHGDDSPPESAEPPSKRQRARPQKDKEKGKERERDAVRVKEELTVVSLSEHAPAGFPNEDHCSACRSLGALVYCDGCTKAFHWLCLDPPMEASDLPEGESRWFCPACLLEQRPPPKPPASLKFMGPLVHELGHRTPTEFQLPQDVRSFFKDVGTGTRGTYQDMSEVKQARFNRHGQLEDRDPYRLKDRNGEPVLCFRCGTSALPPGLAADSPTAKRARRSTSTNVPNYETGRAIISCDYCHLHWHLDCLDPPMITMPPWSKKWMCPNHAEHTLQLKRRIPRANATPIDIMKPRQWNNGNIEIIQADSAPPPAIVPGKVNVDEVLINGRRYRVPERIITLDFWDKVAKNRRGESASVTEIDGSSAMSSPLTSLSSLDDHDSVPPFSMEPAMYSMDDVNFAQMLCNLRLQSSSDSRVPGEDRARSNVNGVHGAKRIKVEEGTSQTALDRSQSGAASTSIAGGDTTRPKRAARVAPSRSHSTRRSGRSGDGDIMAIDFDLPPLVISSGKRPDARRKAARPPEAADSASHAPAVNGTASTTTESDKTASDATEVPSASVSGRPKRNRQPAKSSSSRAVTIKPDPDADPPTLDIPLASASRKKANGTSRASKPSTPPTVNGKTPVASADPKPEATPTLKIRLPRLGAFNSPSAAKESVLETSRISPTKPAAPAVSTRPRRSLRRQASIPTSLNSASVSDAGSSSRVNDPGLSASPIESF
ncbi:hypothetical protein BD311DRAFT_662317 [Dichomitus squalens]|uniref:PHD-type domain-containing protein n=1 Tax=Dichomitus squalens TaxID=114155 RepID=A0A4Q9MN84_9APHY|nr:hypothetical protein BD311DRAFT_662317 [Dichomitus squalens]